MSSPAVFWCTSLFLMVWSVAYLGLVIFTFFIATPDHWAGLVSEGRIKPEYAVYIKEIPSWTLWVTVGAALTRLSGGVALLLQSSLALPLYGVSLVLVSVIFFRGFVLADAASVIRGSQIFVEVGFFILSVFAVWFAYANTNSGRLL